MSQPVSIRLPEHITTTQLDEKAKELGMSRAAFIVNAIETFLGLDKGFYQRLEEYAKALNIPAWLVMQNMLIKRMAKEAADFEVWGPGQHLLEEFRFTNQGPITGEELFNSLKEMYIWEEEKEKAKVLAEEQKYGIPVSDEE